MKIIETISGCDTHTIVYEHNGKRGSFVLPTVFTVKEVEEQLRNKFADEPTAERPKRGTKSGTTATPSPRTSGRKQKRSEDARTQSND